MTTATLPTPTVPPAADWPFVAPVTLRRFTVDEYHRMLKAGVLISGERCELLHGFVVQKMSRNPPHESAIAKLNRRLVRMCPDGWVVRCQGPVTLDDHEPEPDFLVSRGDEDAFDARHPEPADVAVAVEESDSSLLRDRRDKMPIYAAAGMPVYWIVNVIDRQIEVHTDPTGPDADPRYRTVRTFVAGETVSVELDGIVVGTIAVDEVIA